MFDAATPIFLSGEALILEAGHVCEVGLEGLGVLRNPVAGQAPGRGAAGGARKPRA